MPKKLTSLKNSPDFTYESASLHPVCGIDEAGRGPLAGPVVAAAVILDPDNIPHGLNDSKALSQSAREHVLNDIRAHALIGIGISEPAEIDQVNILASTMIAMQRAFHALPIVPQTALIDGNRYPDLPCETQAIVKGDAKCLSIAAASIVAKVTRDNLMALADDRFPGYGFAGHKGYGTKAHREAIATLGPCPIHRFSFAPMRQGELFWRPE
ncbi:ribonuclease HII [Fretibacter rubidus]|uniref:ribonuclease HII n=1 Tax=Fretibacter rubidus TaxID=570162 RepID=UPI00352AE140